MGVGCLRMKQQVCKSWNHRFASSLPALTRLLLLQVRKQLSKVDPYFSSLADGMTTWIAAWRQLNPAGGQQEAAQNHKLPNGKA